MNLPERINVMKVVSYDVPAVCQDIHDFRETPFDEITIEDVLDYIEDWIDQDIKTHGIGQLIIQDENGEEL